MLIPWRFIDKNGLTVADFKDHQLAYAITKEAQDAFSVSFLDVVKSPNSGDDLSAMPDDECLTWGAGRAAIKERLAHPVVVRSSAKFVGTEGAGNVDPTKTIEPSSGYGGLTPDWSGHPVTSSLGTHYYNTGGVEIWEIPFLRWSTVQCPIEATDDVKQVRLGAYPIKFWAFAEEHTMTVTIPDLSNDEQYMRWYRNDKNGGRYWWCYSWDVKCWPPGTYISSMPDGLGNRAPTERTGGHVDWSTNNDLQFGRIEGVTLIQIPDNPWDRPGGWSW